MLKKLISVDAHRPVFRTDLSPGASSMEAWFEPGWKHQSDGAASVECNLRGTHVELLGRKLELLLASKSKVRHFLSPRYTADLKKYLDVSLEEISTVNMLFGDLNDKAN